MKIGIVIVLVFCSFITTNAQTYEPRCASDPVTDGFLQYVYKSTSTNKPASARLSAEPTRIAIKAIFLLGSTRIPPSQIMLDSVLFYLDKYFKPLNITFYWFGLPTYVRDEKFANTVDNDALNTTRAVYDTDKAINLYFGVVSAAGAGRSFAAGPGPFKSSNYVYLNTLLLDNYYILNYIFRSTLPHEFGHYFGLDHTFAGSNLNTIAQRELVTRGPGANCESQGDRICDTPSDPYERLATEDPNWSITQSTCQLTTSLTDANGEKYASDLRNFMSYYSLYSCSGEMHFTEGQYERMRLGLAYRLTYTCYGNESYSIKGVETGLPRVSFDRIVAVENGELSGTNTQYVCLGATAKVAYSTVGDFLPNEAFQVESTFNPFLDGKNMPVFKPIDSGPVTGVTNQLAIHFTDSTLVSSSYPYISSIRIVPTRTLAISCVGSNYFYVVKPGTVRVAFTKTQTDTMTVDFGQSVSLTIRADKSPYGQAYGKGQLLINDQQFSYQTLGYADGQQMNQFFYKNSRIRLLNGTVGCGFVKLAGDLTVTVRLPAISLLQPKGLQICAGESITLPLSVTGAARSLLRTFRAQLSDANGQFRDDSTTIIGVATQSSITLQFPNSLTSSDKYRVRMQGATTQGWVAALPGVAFTVGELPVALLQTPSTTIVGGDSVKLAVELTGVSPWFVKLSDGQSELFAKPQAAFSVRPFQTTVYQLTGVQNACGTGTVSGSTTITVLLPLATDQSSDGMRLRLWPNPTDGEATVEFWAPANQFVTLRITNVSGHLVQSIVKKGNGKLIRYDLSLGHLPAGVYQLSVEGVEESQTLRFLKQ